MKAQLSQTDNKTRDFFLPSSVPCDQCYTKYLFERQRVSHGDISSTTCPTTSATIKIQFWLFSCCEGTAIHHGRTCYRLWLGVFPQDEH